MQIALIKGSLVVNFYKKIEILGYLNRKMHQILCCTARKVYSKSVSTECVATSCASGVSLRVDQFQKTVLREESSGSVLNPLLPNVPYMTRSIKI